ncbi:MAG: hypothetical protein ACI8UO_005285 [Verrucomicrobiales bacterium]|jgi:hypothetical protein
MTVEEIKGEIEQLPEAERFKLIESLTPKRAVLTPEWRERIRTESEQALAEDKWVN